MSLRLLLHTNSSKAQIPVKLLHRSLYHGDKCAQIGGENKKFRQAEEKTLEGKRYRTQWPSGGRWFGIREYVRNHGSEGA